MIQVKFAPIQLGVYNMTKRQIVVAILLAAIGIAVVAAAYSGPTWLDREQKWPYTISKQDSPSVCEITTQQQSDKFIVEQEDTWLYFVIKTATSQKNLDMGQNEGYAFSPDGDSVAYIDRDHQLMIADVTGKATLIPVTGITSYVEMSSHPAWSPDGKKVAFVRDNQLFTVNPDGDELTLITGRFPGQTDFAVEGYPLWSPDGRSIAFMATISEPESDEVEKAIFIIYLTTGSLQQVDSGTESLSLGSWNLHSNTLFFKSDGQFLAFDRTADMDKEIGQVIGC